MVGDSCVTEKAVELAVLVVVDLVHVVEHAGTKEVLELAIDVW